MKVFLLEDDLSQRQFFTQLIRRQIAFKDYPVTFFWATGSSFTLKKRLAKEVSPEDFLLFFLDLHLKNEEETGFSVGSFLKATYPNAKLVFLTTHEELMPLAFQYQLEALDFLAKENPQVETKLSQCLDTAFSRFQKENKQELLTLSLQGKLRQFILADILFFEASSKPHRLTLHLKNQQLDFYGRLKDIPSIHPQLLQVHQSYVVNRRNIQEYQVAEKKLLFINGETCFVSRSYEKMLKAILQQNF